MCTSLDFAPDGDPCDEVLASAARRGDRQAFERLATRHQVSLLRLLKRFARSHVGAEDLVQEVMLRVYKSLHLYQPEKPFRPWLFTVAWRVALAGARRVEMTTEAGPRPSLASRDPGPEDLVQCAEANANLWAMARRELSEAQFAAVCLYYIEGLSMEQIGQVLNLSPSAAKVLLHRAKIRLREYLPHGV